MREVCEEPSPEGIEFEGILAKRGMMSWEKKRVRIGGAGILSVYN